MAGRSDVHGVYNSVDSDIAAAVVFAEQNEGRSLINAVRDGYSAAVDMISGETRLGGRLRFARYAGYLPETYFPELEASCREEGRLMEAYICGTGADVPERLNAPYGRTDAPRKKLYLNE